MDFSFRSREKILAAIPKEEYDVLVIGGGITGCGIALDATLRGMRTILVERGDFAIGTSSRSTKLIHGGLRYLAQGEIKLVREAGMERNALLAIAPHLVQPMPFLIPTKNKWRGAMTYYPMTVGLWMYDRLAHVRPYERRIMLSPEQLIQLEPLLKGVLYSGGGRYFEYVTDDGRLTLEVAKTAHEYGAHMLNYVEMADLSFENGKVNGAIVRDVFTKEQMFVKAAVVVNAAGPWVDDIRRKDSEELKGKQLFHSKGIHLVFDRRDLPVSQAVTLLPDDGRIVFVIPRGHFTYVGTTDTAYTGDLTRPYPTDEDVKYLIDVLNTSFPSRTFHHGQILSSWAGIRPLIHEEGKKPGEISRADEMMVSQTGLISIAGGKLTAYRKMAERVVNYVQSVLEKSGRRTFNSCQTLQTPLTGAVGISHHFHTFRQEKTAELLAKGFDKETAERLVTTYGRHTDRVIQLMEDSNGRQKLHRNLLVADVMFAVLHEQALTVCDVLERRQPLFLFSHDQGRSAVKPVAELMAKVLAWTPERTEKEVEAAFCSISERNKWKEGYRG